MVYSYYTSAGMLRFRLEFKLAWLTDLIINVIIDVDGRPFFMSKFTGRHVTGCLHGETAGSIHKPCYKRLTQTGGTEKLEHGMVKFTNPKDIFSVEENRRRIFDHNNCPREIKNRLETQKQFDNNVPMREDYLQKVCQPEFQDLCLFYYPTDISIQMLTQTWRDRFLNIQGLAPEEDLATARVAGIKSSWMWAIIDRKPSRGKRGDLPLVVALYAQCVFRQETGENFFKLSDVTCQDSIGRLVVVRFDVEGGIKIPRLKMALDASSPYTFGSMLPYE